MAIIQAACRVIILSTFADSRYSRFDAQVDVAEGTLSTAVERFGGHRRSDLKQIEGTGLTALVETAVAKRGLLSG